MRDRTAAIRITGGDPIARRNRGIASRGADATLSGAGQAFWGKHYWALKNEMQRRHPSPGTRIRWNLDNLPAGLGTAMTASQGAVVRPSLQTAANNVGRMQMQELRNLPAT